jgi:NitT/TauT family transport system substrate-binding protein
MGSPNQFFATSVIRRHGLTQKNVSIIAVGVFTSSVAALERNRVDAAVLAGSGINLYQKRNPNSRILLDVRTSEGLEDAFGVKQFVTSVFVLHPEMARRQQGDRKAAGQGDTRRTALDSRSFS